MQNIRNLSTYNEKIGFSYINIFFCFLDFLFGFIYFLISKNYMKIFFYLLSILTIDILKRVYEIYFFSDESSRKSLIILFLSISQFHIIISFLLEVLSNLEFNEETKKFHLTISSCIYGSIIEFDWNNYNSIKFALMILLIFHLNYFLRKEINEFIIIFLDKIGDNIFLYGVLYNIPYLIYFAAFVSCVLTFLTFFINDGYISYISLGYIICNELLKNCVFIFLSGIVYLSIMDLEAKNVNKSVEIKVGKM